MTTHIWIIEVLNTEANCSSINLYKCWNEAMCEILLALYALLAFLFYYVAMAVEDITWPWFKKVKGYNNHTQFY